MKCRLLLDQFADVSTIREEDKAKLQFKSVTRIDPVRGKITVSVPYFPAGTVFEHDVVGFITRGQAAPEDDEATAACGLSPQELAKVQHAYRRITAGIAPEDYELFDAGVILGYLPNGEYKPGPAWDAWQRSRAAAEQAESDI